MTIEKAIEMIDEYLLEPNNINKEWVECLQMCKQALLENVSQKAEIERLQKAGEEAVNCFTRMESLYKIKCKELEVVKAESIKELGDKITEIFMRYSHLHPYAEGARKDYIETVDGKEIEMQSVWDVITLQMNGMAEYEEMCRLQKNIETIEKERLLTELEKDFRLLVKEMVGDKE